jgi:hypothetical protein
MKPVSDRVVTMGLMGAELSREGQMGQLAVWAGVSAYFKTVDKWFP